MGPYQTAVRREWNEWLKLVAGRIPKGGQKDTRAKLRLILQRLWTGLGRPEPRGWMEWSEGRLYAEFYERQAEAVLKERWPERWREVRDAQDLLLRPHRSSVPVLPEWAHR